MHSSIDMYYRASEAKFESVYIQVLGGYSVLVDRLVLTVGFSVAILVTRPILLRKRSYLPVRPLSPVSLCKT